MNLRAQTPHFRDAQLRGDGREILCYTSVEGQKDANK